jgi:transposase-like protein
MSELNSARILEIFRENVAREAKLYTDEARHYVPVGKAQTEHQTVNHAQGVFYKPGDVTVHTQTVENYYSVFKRGMRGTYQHCARKHLHRYCAEFDFRYSNRVAVGVHDHHRADMLLQGVVGKRLTYRAADRGRNDQEVLT